MGARCAPVTACRWASARRLRALLARAGESLSPAALPPYAQQVTLRVIPGPQAERFTQRGWHTFLSSAYTLSPLSDRMGYRLGGPPVEHTAGADILSEGVVMGSLQVPGSGQLLALMADRQTAGGYTKIATVISADLPLLAQLVPGGGTARFALTDLASARSAWLARMEEMRSRGDQMIDLNCDLGEEAGDDAAMMALITSANIACGFHAGDPLVMARTVQLAAQAGVAARRASRLPGSAGFWPARDGPAA